jgi:predicted nucleic acid-binding protein
VTFLAVITNTTLISNFASIGQIDLLRVCWGKLFIPEQVYLEIQEGLLHGYSFYELIDHQVTPLSPDGWLVLTSLHGKGEYRTFRNLLGNLHHGEAACLAIAHERKWLFLSDDQAARRAAFQFDIPVSGTLGVLVALVKRRLLSIDHGDHYLHAMIKKGYYSPVRSLSELVDE